MFPFFRKKDYFNPDEQQRIVKAVQSAEQQTSGEVRVFVESRCSYMDAVDRAAELFFSLGMNKTKDRNGVLVYVAMKDHQLAVFGDEGIHNKVGAAFWQQEVEKMIRNFNIENYADGISEIVTDIGGALRKHFPYNKETDRNELPDDIVFGR